MHLSNCAFVSSTLSSAHKHLSGGFHHFRGLVHLRCKIQLWSGLTFYSIVNSSKGKSWCSVSTHQQEWWVWLTPSPPVPPYSGLRWRPWKIVYISNTENLF